MEGWRSAIKHLKEQGYENVIPITDDTGNCWYCFDYNQDPKNPPIVFIVGDYEKDDPRSIIRVADNFTQLLQKLED